MMVCILESVHERKSINYFSHVDRLNSIAAHLPITVIRRAPEHPHGHALVSINFLLTDPYDYGSTVITRAHGKDDF